MHQKKPLALAYQSINKFENMSVGGKSNISKTIEASQHPMDPELVCQEKQLDDNIEEEIKDGFFELK